VFQQSSWSLLWSTLGESVLETDGVLSFSHTYLLNVPFLFHHHLLLRLLLLLLLLLLLVILDGSWALFFSLRR